MAEARAGALRAYVSGAAGVDVGNVGQAGGFATVGTMTEVEEPAKKENRSTDLAVSGGGRVNAATSTAGTVEEWEGRDGALLELTEQVRSSSSLLLSSPELNDTQVYEP